MTLNEIKTRCKKAGFKYSYGVFSRLTNPPHVVGNVIESSNFGADNIVFYKKSPFQLELTTLQKNIELQNKIENEVLYDVYWEKTESYISKEEVLNTSYFFEIKEE